MEVTPFWKPQINSCQTSIRMQNICKSVEEESKNYRASQYLNGRGSWCGALEVWCCTQVFVNIYTIRWRIRNPPPLHTSVQFLHVCFAFICMHFSFIYTTCLCIHVRPPSRSATATTASRVQHSANQQPPLRIPSIRKMNGAFIMCDARLFFSALTRGLLRCLPAPPPAVYVEINSDWREKGRAGSCRSWFGGWWPADLAHRQAIPCADGRCSKRKEGVFFSAPLHGSHLSPLFFVPSVCACVDLAYCTLAQLHSGTTPISNMVVQCRSRDTAIRLGLGTRWRWEARKIRLFKYGPELARGIVRQSLLLG